MRTVGNVVYVEIESELEDKIKTESGLELEIAADFDLYNNAKQEGTIFACNQGLTDRFGVREGDIIYFHHFVPVSQTMHSYYESQAEEVEGRKMYKAFIPEQVYGYTRPGENTVHMISHWNFVEPIKITPEKTDSGIFLTAFEEEEVFQEGILKYINDDLKALGCKPGDRVRFSEDSEYEMNILGQRLWRMRNEDILAMIE